MVTRAERSNRGLSFVLLDQQGPFATLEHCTIPKKKSLPPRTWETNLDSTEKFRHRAVTSELFALLGVESFEDVQNLISNPEARQQASQHAYRLLAGIYEIEGGEVEIRSRIDGYARVANEVMDYLIKGNGVLSPFADRLETSNEIPEITDPVDLLLIPFDPRYSLHERFEAKRKFALMNIAGAVDQRERELRTDEKFRRFLGFLNEHIWNPDAPIADSTRSYLFSTHSPENFACESAEVLTEEQANAIQFPLEPGKKITLVQRRSFKPNAKPIEMYVTTRKKNAAEKVLKVLRKGTENPAVAIEDDLGLLGVLDTERDVELFRRHLIASAAKTGSFIMLEEIYNTLPGGVFKSKNTGSSPDLRQLQFFARMGGMRIEFILHTNETYADYRYRRGIAHEEYVARRILDSGVAELLAPKDIFGIDWEGKAEKDYLMGEIIRRIETPQARLP